MPKFIEISTKKTVDYLFNSVPDFKTIEKLKIVVDTEYQEDSFKMSPLGISIFIPQIDKKVSIVFNTSELTDNFDPITKGLKALGINAELASEESLEELIDDIGDTFEEVIQNPLDKDCKKRFKAGLKDGLFDQVLERYNLSKDSLIIKKHQGEHSFEIKPYEFQIHLETFFGVADLFKVWGKSKQDFILEASLESRRVIKILNGGKEFNLWIDGILYGCKLILRDAINRIPPRNKSLDNQSKIFKANVPKLNIKTEDVAKIMGLSSPEDIMANLSLLLKYDPNLFTIYAGLDAAATHYTSEGQIKYVNHLRESFGLEPLDDISDTTGSNVAQWLRDLIFKHFIDSSNIPENKVKKLIRGKIKQSHIKHLQNLEYNNHGVQPMRTVGGLLYSRVQRFPIIKGLLGDLDLKSCYATAVCNLNLYLGEHIVTTFRSKKYKPKLIETINFVTANCPNDGWTIRVTGQLEKSVNTLIYSDLRFKNKKEKVKTIWDKNPGKRIIEEFNAEKIYTPQAQSTILTKEIKYGLITYDLWQGIQLLPSDWVKEFENLLVDCLHFIPYELICDSIEDYNKKLKLYPEDGDVETFDPKTGLKEIQLQYSQKNLCLNFPINTYFPILREKRNKLKKEKNPIQEVYKLFSNSTYGALACIYLAINNLLAANQITAMARANAWMMINFLNGFQAITDGTTFSWNNIAIGYKLKEILFNNPNYLIDYDPNITNKKFNYNNANQEWIDKQFNHEMLKFYDIDHSHPLAFKFDFELKDETFIDKSGQEIKSVFFTDFYNTGSGNYVKGMNGSHILLEGCEFDFYSFEHIKARSFKGDNKELINWYIKTIESGYTSPHLYSEKQIIKFAEGNDLAIRFLDKDPTIKEICHPMGFTKKVYKVMKLITRSQFPFQTETQLKNFEHNYNSKLYSISKFILNKTFWKNLKVTDIKKWGITELRPNIDYYEYSKNHPVGIGYELLALNNTNKGSISSVRNFIANKILLGKYNFNPVLNLDRSIYLFSKHKYFLAALIIFKAHSEDDLKLKLLNSFDQPTLLTITHENINTLTELLHYDDYQIL